MPCVFKSETGPRFHWLHTWTKWETVHSGYHYSYNDENGEKLLDGVARTIGYWERQRRECECCGKRQLRKVAA